MKNEDRKIRQKVSKASEAKRQQNPRAKQSGVGRRTGLFCVALNGEDARSVKQAILFERSELNRL